MTNPVPAGGPSALVMRCLVLVALATGAHATSPYGAPEIQAFEGRPGDRGVVIHVAPLPGAQVPEAPVPYTVEPWVLAVKRPPAVLAERDVLGTGLALDLDGDGRRSGRWPLACSAGIWQVGAWPIQPLGLRLPADPPRLGPRGAAVLLHTPCSEAGVVVGFDPPARGAPTPRERLPGPLLQVSLVEPAQPRQAPRLSMSGFSLNTRTIQPFRTFSVRSFVAEPKPAWVHVQVVLVPVPAAGAHQLDFRVEGVGEGVISAAVATSPGPDQRVLSPATGRALPRLTQTKGQ